MLTASSTHNWAKGGGLELVGRLEVLACFWEERRILGLCFSLFHSLSLSHLASLCDLWSLTSCLHMGGHGCGVEGTLKWEEWGRVYKKEKKELWAERVEGRASIVLSCEIILFYIVIP